jgi:cytochrome c553
MWDSGNLYLLFDITDDRIYDGHRTATDSYWEDDTVEIFIDENKSGGQHEYNTSAWAYHISTYGDVIDYTTSGPKLLNDHVTMRMVSVGDKHMWEMSVRIYDASYADNAVNTPLMLTSGKLMGFSAAYIDNDGSSQRESMMGSVDTQGHINNLGYQDASVFGTMQLIESSNTSSTASSVTSSVSSSVSSSVNSSSSSSIGGDVTRGKTLWESTAIGCVFCHAVNSDGTAGAGSFKIDPQNLRYTTAANLVNFIEVNMPKGNPTACVGQCAADTAAYFQSLKPTTSALVTEDFELGVLNTPPANWVSIITNSSIANQYGSQPYALVDNTKAHNGSKSLHVKTDSSASSPVWLMKQLPSGISQAYIRAWMYSPIQLGNSGSQNSGNHGAFMGTVTAKDNNANEQRYGLVEGTRIGAFQPKPGDTPNTASSGDSSVYVPAGRWTCVEFGLDVANNKLYGWVDDKASFTVASLSDWKQGGAALTSSDLNYVELGWRGFGSTNPSDLWFDDIVISTTHVGCN